MSSLLSFPTNFFSLGVLIIGLLIVYLLGLIVAASYVYFTPRSLASFVMVIALIFWTLPWIIIGNTLMVDISALLTALLVIYTIYKVRKKRKSRKGGSNPLTRSDS